MLGGKTPFAYHLSLLDTTFWSHSSQDDKDFRGLRLAILLTVVALYFLLSANSSECYSRDIFTRFLTASGCESGCK